MCDVLSCFVTFPCGALGQVWYLIISIPDLCTLIYFISRRGRGGKRVIARHLILIQISMIKRNWVSVAQFHGRGNLPVEQIPVF